MGQIQDEIQKIMEKALPDRIIISKPSSKESEYKKIDINIKEKNYQIAKYTDKQVFHENTAKDKLAFRIEAITTELAFRQINLWTSDREYTFLLSKKGELKVTGRNLKPEEKRDTDKSHNRTKKYLIEEGQQVPPLYDMGVFTREGKVVRTMYDKFRQINRFLEILDDEIGKLKTDTINVIDFGCGKSYLTFVVYYYLTEVKGIRANIIGLDLKKDVISKCNQAAQKYGYEGLKFELGDINGFKAPFDVDLVITLHACDTATDYALYNAVCWNAKMIFSVPCCQHELNSKISSEKLALLTRYGIVKERFAALLTDSIRANLLEYMGYKTQLLEFIDLEHTPKNILIRAVKRPVTPKGSRDKALDEVKRLLEEFDTDQTLYNLLIKNEGKREEA